MSTIVILSSVCIVVCVCIYHVTVQESVMNLIIVACVLVFVPMCLDFTVYVSRRIPTVRRAKDT